MCARILTNARVPLRWNCSNTGELCPRKTDDERNRLSIKCTRENRSRWVSSAGFAAVLIGVIFLGWTPWGESTPFGIQPGAITSTNFSLTITNGYSTNYYEIYLYDVLEEDALSIRTVPGTLGQTNFTIDTEGRPWLFYKAAVDNDWDDDGIVNIHDADPNNSAIGALTITIETPLNGANLQ